MSFIDFFVDFNFFSNAFCAVFLFSSFAVVAVFQFELRAMTEVPFSPFLQRCIAAFESATDIFFVVDLASGGDLFYHLASKVK